MADLNQLHDALVCIRLNRKTAKLFFYFVNKDDGKMQSGFFSISEGTSCCINYLNKPNETALAEIPHLCLTKVMSLPATLLDFSNQPFPACELDTVINQLKPAGFIRTAAVPEPEVEVARVHVEAAAEHPPHIFYSHAAIQQDAIHLLESLFGTGATQRVEEIALTLPPRQYPTEFLNKCKLHASMMIGPRKAEEIFQPIYKKLALAHEPRDLINHPA
ncbi:MAG: hypothetical protein ABI644_13615 [Arenimonas sp.]